MSWPLAVAAFPRDVPLVPDAGEARRWAERELADPIYDDSPSLIERLTQWFLDLLESLTTLGGSAPPSLAPLIVVAAVAVVALLALFFGGRVRRRRRARVGVPSAELFDDARSSAALREAADAAAARGDVTAAVLDRYRAIVRSLDERGLIEERPGLTAHEAAELGAAALPAHRDALRWAGSLFDAVAYGHARATAEHDAALRALADAIRSPAGSRA